MIYADTNFIAAAFFEDAERHPVVARFLRKNDGLIAVGELAELEAENVFARLSGQPDGPAWRDLQACLDAGEWRREPVNWAGTRAEVRQIIRKYSHRTPLGTLELMHLAAARLAGCRGFASFDTGSAARALAAGLGFDVFPELNERDRQLLTRLKKR